MIEVEIKQQQIDLQVPQATIFEGDVTIYHKTNYELAVDQGFIGTIDDYLESLKGEDGNDGSDGDDGEDGQSAYEIWLDEGNTGNISDFLDSLKGEKGDKGDDGDPGTTLHSELTDREVADAHPISAITGLQDELDTIPTLTSELTNDSGFITSHPVDSVNGQTGIVSLDTDDIAEGVNKYDKIVGLLAGAGISVTGTYPNFTVTNTSPDQVVSLTAGTNINITGTYPNFTVNSEPAGATGEIQFNNGGVFGASENLRISGGTLIVKGSGGNAIEIQSNMGAPLFRIENNGVVRVMANNLLTGGIISGGGILTGQAGLNSAFYRIRNNAGAAHMTFFEKGGLGAAVAFGTDVFTPNVSVLIRGSGSTNATATQIWENASGVELMRLTDGGSLTIQNRISSPTLSEFFNIKFNDGTFAFRALQGTVKQVIIGDTGVTSQFRGIMDLFGSSSSAKVFGLSTYNYRIQENGQIMTRSDGVNAFIDPSAQIEIASTTRGFLPSRMTTTQKNAIATPAEGLVVYDNTTKKLCCYDGTTWNDLF